MNQLLSMHIPKIPVIIITSSFKQINFCTWDTTNWSIPTVSYPGVQIPCVKAFKVSIQRDKSLKQNKTKKLILFKNMPSPGCVKGIFINNLISSEYEKVEKTVTSLKIVWKMRMAGDQGLGHTKKPAEDNQHADITHVDPIIVVGSMKSIKL